MKKNLFFALFMSITSLSFGQLIPKAGVTLSSISFDDDDKKSKLGFTLGLAYNIKAGEVFSIQPELNFIQKGVKIKGSDGTSEFESKWTLNYLELPVLAKVTFGSGTKFFLNAGPSLGLGLGGKHKNKFSFTENGTTISGESDGKIKFGEEPDNADEETEYLDNRMDFGFQLGGGILIADKVMLDLRYGLGLSNIVDHEADDDATSKNRVLQFTVGIPLGK